MARDHDAARELEAARREAQYYRRVAEEAGRRRLREAETLSGLLERAQQAEREVERARAELEKRVEERTAEIATVNEYLRGVVAERERTEEERRRLEQQMDQAQRQESLGVLAGGIAHDFNNLLTSILANVEILRAATEAGTSAGACLADVETAARTAAGLCQQMLAYAGRARVEAEPIDMSVLVRSMLQLLRSSVSHNLLFEVRLPRELPLVKGDPSRLKQVVMNLVVNAAEAIGAGHGTVTVSAGAVHAGPERLRQAVLGEALSEGDYLVLEVADTGSGMDEATQRRVFEPFFTTKFAGRGLGLSAVLGIVRQLGGAIELESAPGRGARFRVLLPVADSAPALVQRAASDRWTGEGKVLVVDDEPVVRRALGRMLALLGFELLEAGGGEEALELFRREAAGIRAVILDLTMPRMDGVETLRRLRQLDAHVHVVVASGYAEADVEARFEDQPPDGFVHKPFGIEALRKHLRAALERAPRGG